MDAHLDHPVSHLADPMGFNQKAGEIYWISIVAEVGHKIELIVDPAGGDPHLGRDADGQVRRTEPENPKGHYWGWHTSPIHFNDVATMGHLFMPAISGNTSVGMPIQPRHESVDMAFELYTIPEPASFVLIGLALVAVCGYRCAT